MAHAIDTLPQDELSFFLMRRRRGETLERFEPRLDFFLREILAKAHEFVPSEAGAILLDDPRAKMLGRGHSQLTYVAAYGEQSCWMVGQKIGMTQGIEGRVYSTGRTTRSTVDEEDRAFYSDQDAKTGRCTRSLLGVPVILGNSICGVILLVNRLGKEAYTAEECTLIEIFAGYISCSIQNILDGVRAKELARRDDLTGLFNDRYFHFRLRDEIRHSEKTGGDLSLVFLDLDHFKDVNDQHGHLEGSRTLHEMGLLLDQEAPLGSVIARYGGDEFVIILPSTDVTGALDVARRLQSTISAARFLADAAPSEDGTHISITASMGVASLHDHVPTEGGLVQRANTLIRMADTAMYRAKAEGRNQIIVAHAKTKEYPIVSPPHREPSDTSDRGTDQPGRGSHPGAADPVPRAQGPQRNRPGKRRPR